MNNDGQCEVSGWRDIVAVSAGKYHTVGLKSDGTVVAVGDNKHGQCEVSAWRDIVAVSAGYDHTVGLKSDGTVVAVGYYYLGVCEVSDWKLFKDMKNLDEERKTEMAQRKIKDEEYRLEEQRRQEQQRKLEKRRREQGLCQHCGGSFKGIFTKKCSLCGRTKDY